MANVILTTRLAVLIDADNTPAAIIPNLLTEISRCGTASIKRIYGDWTNTKLNAWKNSLLQHSIQPIQQFSYTTGKNATDSAMIIDIMDILYTNPHLNGFCIVSSDSDFTRLASRLREAGKIVYGFGANKTPEPFRSACDRFIYIEDLGKSKRTDKNDKAAKLTKVNAKTLPAVAQSEKQTQPIVASVIDITKNKALIKLLRSAVDALSDKSGYAELSSVGTYLSRNGNGFKTKNYKCKNLITLIEATKQFEILKENKKIRIKLTS